MQGPQNRPFRGNRVGDGRKSRKPSGRGHVRLQLGQAKIQQLRAGFREHNVSGLQIAVSHTLTVRLVKRVRDLDSISEPFFQRQRPLLETFGECLAFEKLHHHEIGFVLVPDVVKRAYVGMIQAGNNPSFALETLAPLRVIGKTLRKNFNGDSAAEARVGGTIYFAHPALAQQGRDFVRPKLLANLQRHDCGLLYGRATSGAIQSTSLLGATRWGTDGANGLRQ